MKKSKANEDISLDSATKLLKKRSTENILVFLVLAIFIFALVVFSSHPHLLQKNISQTTTDTTEKYVWLTGSPEMHEGLYLFRPEQFHKNFPKIGPPLAEQSIEEIDSPVHAIAYNEGKYQPMSLPPEVANIFFKPIPLNRADKNILTSLPGIGPVLAERIVLRRDQYGPFQSKDELLQIAGIGPKKYAGLVAHITLD